MPPKSKTEEKKKAKVVEDKTFGLKNKNKSKKVQKFIEAVAKTNQPKKGPVLPTKKELKEEEEKKKEEMALLFKPAIESKQKVAPGVDPKSIVCEFFMKGTCKKGSKCKFSHDLDMARKSAKIDIYSDRRDEEDENSKGLKGADGEYDESTLMEAIEKKANRVQTSIVCKHFIDAIERKLYGWFWECPSGPTCIYRHALPPGYVLKSMMAKDAQQDDDEDKMTIEEELDEARAKIINGTPINNETFAAWKRRKAEARALAAEAAKSERAKQVKSGHKNMSGRELFAFNPELFADDDEAMGGDAYVIDEENQEPLYDITNLGKGTAGVAGDNEEPGTADEVPVDESLFADEDEDDEEEEDGEEEGDGPEEEDQDVE